MTLSKKPITDGQIGKLNQNVTAHLLKHKNEIPSDIFQQVLGDDTLIDDFYSSIMKRVEVITGMIIRKVAVNRAQSPVEMLKATGRVQYTDENVVKTIPKGEGEETKVFFFKIGRQINDNDLEKEYAVRGLQPADPYSQAKVNQDDPAFADTHPNGTHWKDVKGEWCFCAFNRWGVDKRFVNVFRNDGDWDVSWWFAGVRKSTQK